MCVALGPVIHGAVRKAELRACIQEVVAVNDDPVLLDQHHAVCGRLEAAQNRTGRREIQRDLMIHCSQRRQRDAAPAAGERPVNMSKEEVANATAVRLDYVREPVWFLQ